MTISVAEKSIASTIAAHDSDLGFICVNPDGTLIASASVKGTRIKIFSADGGDCLQELRRGSTHALLTQIIFHPSLQMIACCSNKNSIHIYEIKQAVSKCIEQK